MTTEEAKPPVKARARFKRDPAFTREPRPIVKVQPRPNIKDLARGEDGRPWCHIHGAARVVMSVDKHWKCDICGTKLGKVPSRERQAAPRGKVVTFPTKRPPAVEASAESDDPVIEMGPDEYLDL